LDVDTIYRHAAKLVRGRDYSRDIDIDGRIVLEKYGVKIVTQ
jgi:hypothetical protein